jgi:3',5'-cyclic AMP phosphodiesterase CpdA
MLIAQISDFHLRAGREPAYGVADTATALERVVAHLNAFLPAIDAVLITGDIADAGTPESYGLAAELLAPLKMPFYLIPGNHDQKDRLADAFPEHAYLNRRVRGKKMHFICYVIEDHPVRLIGLDTVTPGKHGGGLGSRRLRWLDETLAAARDKPTLIFMHHPPFACGIGHMDTEVFVGRRRLQAIVNRHKQVERLTCGHIHRMITRHFGSTVSTVCPGVGMQLDLDLRCQAPSGFVLEPPAVLIHLHQRHWDAEAELMTHLSVIEEHAGQFGGFHPFFDVISPS